LWIDGGELEMAFVVVAARRTVDQVLAHLPLAGGLSRAGKMSVDESPLAAMGTG
jgi:hypothetical protein